MTVQLHLSDRFYRIFERVACALESISETLKAPPEDFTAEDASVRDATTRAVASRVQLEQAIQDLPPEPNNQQ